MLSTILLALYFTPTFVAYVRKHRNRLKIGTLNLLLGWTGVVWLWCLIMAVDKDVEGYSSTQITIVQTGSDAGYPPRT